MMHLILFLVFASCLAKSPIRECDKENLLDKHDYNVGTVFPCVTFPLTLSMLALAYGWYKLYNEWGETSQILNKGLGALYTVETVFGVLCWVQCLIMIGYGSWWNGESGCEFMGWYTGFYLYGWTLIIGMLALLTGQLYEESSDGEKQALSVEGESSKSFLQKYFGPIVASCIVWGTFVGLWPLIGIIDEGYVYPTAFCVVDLQNTAFGTLYFFSFLFMVVSIFYGFRNVFSRHWVFPAIAAQAILMELFPLIVALAGWAGDSGCQVEPFGIDIGVAFGALAWSQHTNQLLSPFIFGVYWRREIMSLMSQKDTKEAV